MKFDEMQFGAVAFVLAEAILRKLRAEVTHHSIARYLRDNACRRDAQANAIAVDNRGLGQRKWNDRKTVNQDMLGSFGEGLERGAHGPVRRPQNINPINLDVINHADTPDNGGVAR
jgi:hypothetical protein